MKELLPYQVVQPLESAEKSAFFFVRKEDNYNRKTETKQELIEKVDGLSPFWIYLSFIGIPLAIVFAIYESNMAKQAISTLLDPLNLGNINNNMIALIGAGLAVLAMFMGHIFAEGFYKEKHRITGRAKRKMGMPFYFSIIGLIAYITFQYYLVQAAGEGSSEFYSFAMIAIGVAVLEILVGVLILGKSLTYLLILSITIQLWLLGKGMAKKSRLTNNMYRDYRAMLNVWNIQSPSLFMELEGGPNIRKALAYYNGIDIHEKGSTQPADNHTSTEINYKKENVQEQTEEDSTEEEIEQFINNEDDNIIL